MRITDIDGLTGTAIFRVGSGEAFPVPLKFANAQVSVKPEEMNVVRARAVYFFFIFFAPLFQYCSHCLFVNFFADFFFDVLFIYLFVLLVFFRDAFFHLFSNNECILLFNVQVQPNALNDVG